MKLNEKLKTNFILLLGRIYFSAILLIVISLAALLIFLISTCNSSNNLVKINNILKSGKAIVFIFFIIAGLLKGFSKTVFKKLPKPEGILVDKQNFPELYEFIEEIRQAIQCPKIDEVILNFKFGAYITETPGIGMVCRYKRYLVIGIPLLLGLTDEELKAVISHECGHLSKLHGKYSIKIYRAKSVWQNIAKELDKDEAKGSFLVNGFIKRYVPALNSIYFSNSRQYEYEADKIAGFITDNQTFSNALFKIFLYEDLFNFKFWSEISILNHEVSIPIDDVFFRMEKELQNHMPEKIINSYTKILKKDNSLPSSTHPSYIERIKELGISKAVIKQPFNNALRVVFKNKADEVLNFCSKNWSDKALDAWSDHYNAIIEAKNRLSELEQTRNKQQLNSEELLERAFIIEKLYGTEKALEAFKYVKEIYDNNISAEFNIGRLMIYLDDEKGIEILIDTMDKDSQVIPECCHVLVNYYCGKNQQEIAHKFYCYAVEFMNTNEDIKQERTGLNSKDNYLPHDFPMKTIESIKKEILKYKEIKKAYIVRKEIKYSYQFPIYILAIKFKPISQNKSKKIQMELSEVINSEIIMWEFWSIPLNRRNIEIEYKIDQVEEARII